MVAFSSEALERLAGTVPQSDKCALPAYYSKLSQRERVRVREAYIDRQNGNCYHCGNSLHSPCPLSEDRLPINWTRFPGGRAGFLRYPVHLHHDHDTDLTLGAVHAYCNAVLFQYHGE